MILEKLTNQFSNLKFVKENLFTNRTTHVLLQCIPWNALQANAGIAHSFNEYYPQMTMYIEKVHMYNGDTWEVSPKAILYSTGTNDSIINLLSKEMVYHKPTLKTFEDSIRDSVYIIKSHGFKKIALPLVGCGIDGLNFNDVGKILEKYYGELGLEEIKICYRMDDELYRAFQISYRDRDRGKINIFEVFK